MLDKEKLGNWYNKNYKRLLVIPLIIIVVSLIYLSVFYVQNGDIASKDVSLTGGTTLTIFVNSSIDELRSYLASDFSDLSIASIADSSGNQIGLVITTPNQNPDELIYSIENYLGFSLDENNSSVEFTGSMLGQSFYSQLAKSVVFAFLLMALVVFLAFGESKKVKTIAIILTSICARITFPLSVFIGVLVFITAIVSFFFGLKYSNGKKDVYLLLSSFVAFVIIFFLPYYLLILPLAIILLATYSFQSVPSIAVILSAFADIIIPLAIIDAAGVKISSAGIVAFLMLIGYSVDTDILLTTRVLKRKTESVNSSLYGAFKTGVTMTITSIVAIALALFMVFRFESILNQIFTILLIGLGFDLLNTWITNVSIIKWYVEAKK